MKKFTTILVILFLISVSAFADDGQYPIGNKSCPQQEQTCLIEGEIPIGNKTDDTIVKNIFDFLKSILG